MEVTKGVARRGEAGGGGEERESESLERGESARETDVT